MSDYINVVFICTSVKYDLCVCVCVPDFVSGLNTFLKQKQQDFKTYINSTEKE